MHATKKRHAGFSLIELLVVVAILGILIALMTYGVGKARGRAVSMKCAQNLKQLHAASLSYEIDHAGELPHPQGSELIWIDVLPPYLGLKPVVQSVEDGDPYVLNVLSCPLQFARRPSPGYHSYGMNNKFKIGVGAGARVTTRSIITRPGDPDKPVPADASNIPYFLDGVYYNQTILPARGMHDIFLSYRLPRDTWTLSFPHDDACNLVFLDGHLETVPRDQGVLSGNQTPQWLDPDFGHPAAF